MRKIRLSLVEMRRSTSLQTAFLMVCLLTVSFSFAQAPQGYYATAENKSGYALRVAMHNIIKNHTAVSYNELWNSFKTTDQRPDNGKVWDMYSDRPGSTPAYYFTFVSDQCGSYSGEGDCYNREHSVPKSWFGGSVAPMYTDLFHLIPTDGYVNSKRGNLPIGKVTSATWTSTNGSKVGTSNISGYSGQVFEPIDSFKGDFARTYFYMATCYMDKNLGVETLSNFNGGNLKPWSLQLLLQWAAMDPVSQKEIDRNNAIWQIQHNRNPFIDFPNLAEMIFGNDTNTAFVLSIPQHFNEDSWCVYPNPATTSIQIQSPGNQQDINTVEIADITGKVLLQKTVNDSNVQLDISPLTRGFYLISIISDHNKQTFKFVKQ